MTQDMTPTIEAELTIVHTAGSETISNFTRLEEEFTADGTRNLHVWTDTTTDDPDIIYENASITEISSSG